MKPKSLISGVVAMFGTAAFAATVYTPDGMTLVAEVESAETNEFEEAYAKALQAGTYTSLVKKGAGGLMLPDDLSSYMGAITVKAGSLGYRTSIALGSLEPGNGDVTVEDGATLFVPDNRTDPRVIVNSVSPIGKRIVIAGMGVNGAGAIDLRSEQQRNPLGANVVLVGDARVSSRTQYYWGYNGDSRCALDMGGHTLYLHHELSNAAFKNVDITNPGNVDMELCTIPISNTKFGGSSANTLMLPVGNGNDAFVVPVSADYAASWTLHRKIGSSAYINGSMQSWSIQSDYKGVSTNRNFWSGPVFLDGAASATVNFQSPTEWHGGVALLGKVSGAPKIRVYGNHVTDGTAYHHPYLNLVSAENDYTGETIAWYAGIRLWNPGALGQTSRVTLHDGEVCFDNLRDDFGALPPLVVDGSVHASGMLLTNDVRFGRGKWTSVTKTGPGRLLWYSGTGAASVDMQEGYLHLGRRSKIAGLYSSLFNSYSSVYSLYSDPGYNPKLDLEPGVRAPNDPDHAYHNYTYKLDPANPGDAQYAVVVYHGYVWNNSDQDVKWSFVGNGFGHGSCLRINDEVVFEYKYTETTKFGSGSAVLKPGPNKFDFRGFAQLRSQFKNTGTVPAEWTWPTNPDFNFGYDPLGRDSTNVADYQRMEDSGDGSLFTFCLPEESYSYPGHPGETHAGVQPDFDVMKFAAGTGINLANVTKYTANSIVGFPELVDAADFSITNVWTLTVDSLGSSALTTEGRIDLTRATITFDEPAKLSHATADYPKVICTAQGGISGEPAVLPTGKRRWKTVLSADGKSLSLERDPDGFAITIR